jgi:LysR family transcriptional regulator for bpeEF and oprC
MDRLDAMRLFTRVVERGSFSAVAREAGVGQPAVSKQLAALEAHLGAQLLHRSPRSVTLTDEGRRFYEHAVRILGDVAAAEAAVGGREAELSGVLRVTTSSGFGRIVVMPLIAGFSAVHPQLVVDVLVSDRYVDLIEEGVDLAIRLGELADTALIARRVGASRRITVASPTYLARAGVPKHPRDLAAHAGIAFTFRRAPRPWAFATPEGRFELTPAAPVSVNDAELVRAAVLAGMGIAQAPEWLFAADVAAGRVTQLLEHYPGDVTPVQAVFAAGRRASRKVRAFADALAERLADHGRIVQDADPE